MLEAMFIRIENARIAFVDTVVSAHGFTHDEAKKILDVFRHHKVIKIDVNGGSYTVKHGLFWDKVVMLNALNEWEDIYGQSG